MAQRDSEYERIPHDLYETPEWVTEALIPHLPRFGLGLVWEPAAASGKMVNVLRRHYHPVVSSDIRRRRDFLKSPKDAKAIITNPPYSLAKEFIEHALARTQNYQGVVAMLLRVDFDSGSSRRHLFAEHPAFAKKVILTKRIEWFERRVIKGKKQAGPSENHAWFVWNWKNDLPPTIGYAP